MSELALNPFLWLMVFLACLFAFPFFYCVHLTMQILPEEVSELPKEVFLRVRKYYKRSYLAEACIMFILFIFVPADMWNSPHQNLNNVLLAGGCFLFAFSLIHRFLAGRILKTHGLTFFHFDTLVGKRAMKGIQ